MIPIEIAEKCDDNNKWWQQNVMTMKGDEELREVLRGNKMRCPLRLTFKVPQLISCLVFFFLPQTLLINSNFATTEAEIH